MLRDDLAKVRKKAANVAERLVAEKEVVLLKKIEKLEERVKKLESVPKRETKSTKTRGIKDAEL